MEATGTQEVDTLRIPVFIVLSFTGSTMANIIHKFTQEPYSHASIALDYSLEPMYSFNMSKDNSGFVEEDIHNGVWQKDVCKYTMYMFLCTPAQYETIQNLILSIKEKRDRYRYNIKGLFSFLTGKPKKNDDHFFCSEFVSWILQTVDPEHWNKNISTYTPYGLINRKAMIHITKGKSKNYDPKRVKDLVDTKVKEAGFKWKT